MWNPASIISWWGTMNRLHFPLCLGFWSVKVRSSENQSSLWWSSMRRQTWQTGTGHYMLALSLLFGGDDAIVLIWGQWARRSVPIDSCPWTLPVEPLPLLLLQAALSHSLHPITCGHQSIPVCEMRAPINNCVWDEAGKVALRGEGNH